MSQLIPKFVWHDPITGLNQFVPVYAPINKQPQGALEAIRHDSTTTSGIMQSRTERVEKTYTLNFDFVPESDLATWATFMLFATKGNEFFYHPDSTSMTNFGAICMTHKWDPKRVAYQLHKFVFVIRCTIPSDSGS